MKSRCCLHISSALICWLRVRLSGTAVTVARTALCSIERQITRIFTWPRFRGRNRIERKMEAYILFRIGWVCVDNIIFKTFSFENLGIWCLKCVKFYTEHYAHMWFLCTSGCAFYIIWFTQNSMSEYTRPLSACAVNVWRMQ